MRMPIESTASTGWKITGLLLGLFPLLLCAADLSSLSRADRKNYLNNISDVESARLRHNFKQFQELPEEQRRHMRQLHEDLRLDAAQGGNLRQVMDEYYAWLTTLTPGQIEELRSQTSPINRADLVRKLRVQQEERKQQSPLDNFPALREKGVPNPLRPDDLQAVVQVLETALRKMLPAAQIEQLDKLHGPARRFFVVEHAGILQGGAGLPMRRGILGTPGLLQNMINAISDEPLRQWIEDRHDSDKKRAALRFLMTTGIGREFQALKPDAKKRSDVFEKLTPKEQQDLATLPPQELNARLTLLYMKAHPEIFPERLRALLRLGPRGTLEDSKARETGSRPGADPEHKPANETP